MICLLIVKQNYADFQVKLVGHQKLMKRCENKKEGRKEVDLREKEVIDLREKEVLLCLTKIRSFFNSALFIKIRTILEPSF